MIPLKRGAIVTLGSINSRMPLPIPAYNMGKVAIERLTQLLAVSRSATICAFCSRKTIHRSAPLQ